jgi:hypothetical protein
MTESRNQRFTDSRVPVTILFRPESLAALIEAGKDAFGKMCHGTDCTFNKPRNKKESYGECTCGLWALGEALKPFRGDD